MTGSEIEGLIARLLGRAEEDQTCADNSAAVVAALGDEMQRFHDGKPCNLYAVRIAVDHRNSVSKDSRYAADLRLAADLLRATLPAEPSDGIAAARPLRIGQREEGGCRDA